MNQEKDYKKESHIGIANIAPTHSNPSVISKANRVIVC